MDYGDEFNDDEERRYKEETYGIHPSKKKMETQKGKERSQEEDEEEGEEDEEEEESPSEEVVPMAREFSRRTNRGQRMTALVGKALEEDDAFWGGVGAEFFGNRNKTNKNHDPDDAGA